MARPYKELARVRSSTTIKTKGVLLYLKHTEETKNYRGGSKQKDQDYADVRMYRSPGSSMDPISSLKLMLSKFHLVSDFVDKVLQGGRVLVQERAREKEFHRPTYAQDFQ